MNSDFVYLIIADWYDPYTGNFRAREVYRDIFNTADEARHEWQIAVQNYRPKDSAPKNAEILRIYVHGSGTVMVTSEGKL